MIHDAKSVKLRAALAAAHKADEPTGTDANALKAERALVEHWLDEGKALYLIALVDRADRQHTGERVQ